MSGVTTVEIPNRSLFRQPEVCEIAQVQPYVLRSWEAEFPNLGVTKTEGGPRVYRRADLEFVLRIKHLLFVEGLTLAGARRKLLEQSEAPAAKGAVQELDALFGSDARERILQVKRGLREIATMLAKTPAPGEPQSLFDIAPPRKHAAKRVVKKVSAKVSAKKKR
jgi:DNA-binding transcriptional MerR regulator